MLMSEFKCCSENLIDLCIGMIDFKLLWHKNKKLNRNEDDFFGPQVFN